MNPTILVDQLMKYTDEYSKMAEELADILTFKATKWSVLRTEASSDKQADKEWDATAEGLREMKLRLLMKASERQQSSIKTKLRIMDTEARNLL